MVEITGWILAFWTIGTALLCFASSWGAVKYQQKSFEKRLDDFTQGQRRIETKMGDIERTYMSVPDCKDKKADCDKERDYRESQLIRKLDQQQQQQQQQQKDLQSFIQNMYRKQEISKDGLKDELHSIQTDLAILRTSVEYGPITGAPKARPVRNLEEVDKGCA